MIFKNKENKIKKMNNISINASKSSIKTYMTNANNIETKNTKYYNNINNKSMYSNNKYRHYRTLQLQIKIYIMTKYLSYNKKNKTYKMNWKQKHKEEDN